MWHKDLIPRFTSKWYSGVITLGDIPSKKKEVKIKALDKSIPDEILGGWILQGDTQEIFLPDILNEQNTLDLLPIKVLETDEFSFETSKYRRPQRISTFRIKPEKILSFEEIFDLFKFEHTNQVDYTTYLIIMLTQIPLKFNYRLSTTGGFGKTNLYAQICELLPENTVITLKSESKIMKESHKKTSLVVDEFTDTHKGIKRSMDTFFKITGDGANTIKNPAHGTKSYGTLDEYDISKTSYGFFYNTLEDARDKGLADQYFDNIYDFPTCQRYFPMKLSGELKGEQFKINLKDIQSSYGSYEKTYLAFVKSMYYYIENPEEMETSKEDWVWKQDGIDKIESLKAERIKTNLRTIITGVKACSKTKEEFQERCDNIWKAYRRYLDQLKLDSGHEINRPVKAQDLSEY